MDKYDLQAEMLKGQSTGGGGGTTRVIGSSRRDDKELGRTASLFPPTDEGRKAYPVWAGVMMYFPDALVEVAKVSKKGNDQHNPGQPLHWARHKSTDQLNTAIRHLMDHGTGSPVDTDGTLHLAKACWRLLAELQTFLEQAKQEGSLQRDLGEVR